MLVALNLLKLCTHALHFKKCTEYISADEADVKEQEIRKLVAVSCNFCKKHLENLK